MKDENSQEGGGSVIRELKAPCNLLEAREQQETRDPVCPKKGGTFQFNTTKGHTKELVEYADTSGPVYLYLFFIKIRKHAQLRLHVTTRKLGRLTAMSGATVYHFADLAT